MGPIADDEQHDVTYTQSGDPVVRSEPFMVEQPYNAGAILDWRPSEEDVGTSRVHRRDV